MNQYLSQILATQIVKKPNGKEIRLHSHISKEEGTFLQEIVREVKPKVSLEVGLAYGISSLYICDAAKAIKAFRHLVIDPMQTTQWEGIGLHNLKEAGLLDKVKHYQSPSYLTLPKLLEEKVKIDFAFIDGWHTFDFTLIDFFYIDRLLRVGGVVVFDDANWPAVRKVCRYVRSNRSYKVFRCLNRADDGGYGLKTRVGRKLDRLRVFLGSWIHLSAALTDLVSGLRPGSYCIALQKIAEDDRNFNFHRNF